MLADNGEVFFLVRFTRAFLETPTRLVFTVISADGETKAALNVESPFLHGTVAVFVK